MRMANGPKVGVFDSGAGGLTVLKACLKATCSVTYFYFGDNQNAPYGSKGEEEIARLTERGLQILARHKIDAAVLACNTASAVCLESMRKKFPFPIVGMEPAVAPAARNFSRILVLCTPRTAGSERLRKLIKAHPHASITVFAADGLAGAIEDRLLRGKPLELEKHLPKGTFDAVVLGCTHYAFYRNEIAAFYGAEVFDGGEGTAAQLKFLLNLGTERHLRPHMTHFDQIANKCKKQTKNRVIFLGECGKMNKCIFFENICSKSSSKNFSFLSKKFSRVVDSGQLL